MTTEETKQDATPETADVIGKSDAITERRKYKAWLWERIKFHKQMLADYERMYREV